MGHDSVLLKQAIDFLCVNTSGSYLDCTGGLGGHAAELLDRLAPEANLLICDYHRETVQELQERFGDDSRVKVTHSRFSQLFDNLNFSFDGILADLGISSPQLLNKSLGIGFQLDDVPLDMRIDHSLTMTAADLLKTADEKALADIFYFYGGEHASRKLARAICDDRKQNIFYAQTNELRDLCARVLGRYYRNKRIHPATKIFQALRIAVNHELQELETLLIKAPLFLNKGGRLVIISFHSGEDRLVKNRFKELAEQGGFTFVIKKAVKPDRDEIINNLRARSARMRVLEKV